MNDKKNQELKQKINSMKQRKKNENKKISYENKNENRYDNKYTKRDTKIKSKTKMMMKVLTYLRVGEWAGGGLTNGPQCVQWCVGRWQIPDTAHSLHTHIHIYRWMHIYALKEEKIWEDSQEWKNAVNQSESDAGVVVNQDRREYKLKRNKKTTLISSVID